MTDLFDIKNLVISQRETLKSTKWKNIYEGTFFQWNHSHKKQTVSCDYGEIDKFKVLLSQDVRSKSLTLMHITFSTSTFL